MRTVLTAALLATLTGIAHGETPHHCAADAIAKATPLLTLHFDVEPGGKVENMSIDDKVKILPPIRALKGKGKLDVLEVWGHIYKGDYRMRFIYMQTKETCALMGQEIIEASNPY